MPEIATFDLLLIYVFLGSAGILGCPSLLGQFTLSSKVTPGTRSKCDNHSILDALACQNGMWAF